MTNTAPHFNNPARTRLAKIKVLLAEDNEVNQLLAKSILQYWGLESKTATTGSEVVELLKNEDFDVILMDIQMPEKSGIEATQDIRNMTDERKKNIPIIALTANALMGEEKKYIAAGMDDFLTKPFKEHELYEVITRVFNNEGSFGRELSPVTEENAPVISIEKLYDLKNVQDVARGNDEFVLTLIKLFISTIPTDVKEMVKASNEKKWDMTSKLAHKLKSTVDTMNITSLKEVIRTVEFDGKHGVNTQALPALVKKVENVIELVLMDLKQRFNL